MRTPRRITATTLIAGGLLLSAAPAYAVVDPATLTCLTGMTGDLTTLIDPSAPGVPTELPGVSCLQP